MRLYHWLCLAFYGSTGLLLMAGSNWIALANYPPFAGNAWNVLLGGFSVIVAAHHWVCLMTDQTADLLLRRTGVLTISAAILFAAISTIISIPHFHDINAPMSRWLVVGLHSAILRHRLVSRELKRLVHYAQRAAQQVGVTRDE